MSTSDIDSFRKYSMNVSSDEAVDQLYEELQQLLNNSQMHFSKRRKILLQLERKNNQFRRSIDRSDVDKQKKLTDNTDLIRRNKITIIEEGSQQRQQRQHEQEQVTNDSWSIGGMAVTVGAAVAGFMSVATFIIIMLDNSKENIFKSSIF